MAAGAHILQFRSTHQYYKTAKYELHRTIGGGDTLHVIFCGSDYISKMLSQYSNHSTVTVTSSKHQHRENFNVMYLHHQWSDGAHTLQFCSTSEYFETIEYELQRLLGARDIQ